MVLTCLVSSSKPRCWVTADLVKSIQCFQGNKNIYKNEKKTRGTSLVMRCTHMYLPDSPFTSIFSWFQRIQSYKPSMLSFIRDTCQGHWHWPWQEVHRNDNLNNLHNSIPLHGETMGVCSELDNESKKFENLKHFTTSTLTLLNPRLFYKQVCCPIAKVLKHCHSTF